MVRMARLVATAFPLFLTLAGGEAFAASLTPADVAAALRTDGLHRDGLAVTPNTDGRRSYGPVEFSDILNVYVAQFPNGTTQYVLARYVPINDPEARGGKRAPAFDTVARIARLADPTWTTAAEDIYRGSIEAWKVLDQITVQRPGVTVRMAGAPPDLMYFLFTVEGECDLRSIFAREKGCDLAEREIKPK